MPIWFIIARQSYNPVQYSIWEILLKEATTLEEAQKLYNEYGEMITQYRAQVFYFSRNLEPPEVTDGPLVH